MCSEGALERHARLVHDGQGAPRRRHRRRPLAPRAPAQLRDAADEVDERRGETEQVGMVSGWRRVGRCSATADSIGSRVVLMCCVMVDATTCRAKGELECWRTLGPAGMSPSWRTHSAPRQGAMGRLSLTRARASVGVRLANSASCRQARRTSCRTRSRGVRLRTQSSRSYLAPGTAAGDRRWSPFTCSNLAPVHGCSSHALLDGTPPPAAPRDGRRHLARGTIRVIRPLRSPRPRPPR